MTGLEDFVDDAPTEQLHVMQAEYEEQFGDPIVHLWCRDRSNNKRWVEVEGHRPSFYIHRDAFSKRVINHDWVQSVEDGYQSIHDEPLVRVETRLPWHVGGKQDKKGLREYFEQTWEADVFYTSRFLIDTGIKTHLEVDTTQTWDGQSVTGDYRVNVDDITPVEDPSWRATPRVVTADIEVQAPDGFPSPDDAEQLVTAITAHDNHTEEYTVWVLRHEGWDRPNTEIQNLTIENRPDPIEVDDEQFGVNIEGVRVFEEEDRLLHDFNSWVEQQSPDLLGGWNSSTTDNGRPFDYPYLINRCQSLNVMNYRDWSPLGQVWDGNWGPGGKGIGFFDMLKGYKKTQWQKPKGGYSLENITTKELPMGEGKLDIEGIDEAWRDDPGTFLEYNIRDVQAVVGINEAAGVMDLFQNLRHLTGAQFENCHNNIDLLDVFILRFANSRGVALPTNEEPERGWFYGGKVFEPKVGRHENAVYPDVWSEYPNAFRTINMSPETIIGTKEGLEDSEYTEEDCRWSYIDTRPDNVKNPDSMDGAAPPEPEKCYYLKPDIKKGFMNEVVEHVMGLKDDYDGTDLYGPVKQIVNSVWGVYGDSDSYGKGYRLFDWRVAESITLYGRKVIKHTATEYVNSLNKLKDKYGYEGMNAYQVGGDTDSVMTSIPFMCDETREGQEEIVELAKEACEMVNQSYDEFAAETFNSDGTYIKLEIESYAPKLFIPKGVTKEKAKKRYGEIIAWYEGEWYNPPEFSVTGIDIVRSDRAVATRDIARDVLNTILRVEDRGEARDEVYDIISECVEAIKNGDEPNSYIARPKGMSKQPAEYGSLTQTPLPTYRGAKYANQNFPWEQMDAGSKPQLLYIERVRGDWPRTYTAETKEDNTQVDAIACEHPDEVPDEFVVDTDKMIEKVVADPLTPILAAMGWDFDEALADSTQVGIGDFM